MTQSGNISDENTDRTNVNRELTPWLRQRLVESKINFVRTAAQEGSLGENTHRLTESILSRQPNVSQGSSRMALSIPITSKYTGNTDSTSSWEAMTLLLSQPGRNVTNDDNAVTKRQVAGSPVLQTSPVKRVNQSREQRSTVQRKESSKEVKPEAQPAKVKIIRGKIEESTGDIRRKTADVTTSSVNGQTVVVKPESRNTISAEPTPVSKEVPAIQNTDATPSVEITPDAGFVSKDTSYSDTPKAAPDTGSTEKTSDIPGSKASDQVITRQTVSEAGSSPVRTLHTESAGDIFNPESSVESRVSPVESSKSDVTLIDGNSSDNILTKASEDKSEKQTVMEKASTDAGGAVQSTASGITVNIGQITNSKSDTVMKSGESAKSEKNVQSGTSIRPAESRNTFLSVIKTVAGKIIGTKKASVSDNTIGQQRVNDSGNIGSPAIMRKTMATSELTGNKIIPETLNENDGLSNVTDNEQVYDSNETDEYTAVPESVAEVLPAIASHSVSDSGESAQETGQSQISGASISDIAKKETQESLPAAPEESTYKSGAMINKYQKPDTGMNSVASLATHEYGSIDQNDKNVPVKNRYSSSLATASEGKINRSAADLPGNESTSVSDQPDEVIGSVSETAGVIQSENGSGESSSLGTSQGNMSGTVNRTMGLSVTDSGNRVSRKQATTSLSGTYQVSRMYAAIDLPVQRTILPAAPLTRNNPVDDTSLLSALSTPSKLDLPLVAGRQKADSGGAGGTQQISRQIAAGSQTSGTGHYNESQQAVTYVNRAETESALAAGQADQTENRASDLKTLARDIYPYLKKMIMIEKERLPNL